MYQRIRRKVWGQVGLPYLHPQGKQACSYDCIDHKSFP